MIESSPWNCISPWRSKRIKSSHNKINLEYIIFALKKRKILV